jgi:release factor glutamine methyltransferase
VSTPLPPCGRGRREAPGEGAANGTVPSAAPSPSSLRSSTSPASRERLITAGAAILHAAGIDNPRLEARLLLVHALGVPVATLLRDPHASADPTDYHRLVARRAAHEPLAYILGRREFWSLDFAVSPATLIPRPESETLIEAALAAFANRTPPRRILDLGTGTGCLLLAALHEFPGAFGIGTDRAPEAVSLAAANAATLGLAGRAAFLCGDWAAALDARFDLVLCNPPYIPTSDIDGLMQEVARHEPQGALDGGVDGLAAYRRILPTLVALLQPEGVAVLELGVGQAYTVLALARESGLIATTRPDLAGIARALVLQSATCMKKAFGTGLRAG